MQYLCHIAKIFITQMQKSEAGETQEVTVKRFAATVRAQHSVPHESLQALFAESYQHIIHPKILARPSHSRFCEYLRCRVSTSAGSFLGFDGNLFAHGRENNNIYICQYDGLQTGSVGTLLVSFSSVLKSFVIFSPTSPSGTLTSSLVSPSSDMRDKKSSSEMSSYEVVS